jgi:ABC-type transport system involved in cytochrome c biogenesis permease component
MFFAWWTEIRAVLRKEFRQDKRTPSQWLTALLYSTVVVAILGFGSVSSDLRRQPELTASLLSVGLIFGAFASIPRLFQSESELRTLEFLQLSARPESVYWGKYLYGLLQMLGFTTALTPLFIIFSGTVVEHIGLLFLGLFLSQAAMVGAVTFTSAIAAEADARGGLGVAIAAPFVFPAFTIQTSALSYAFGRQSSGGANMTMWALGAIATMLVLLGPPLYAKLWKHYVPT